MTAAESATQAATSSDGAAVERLLAVMRRLRRECPWDARQTHRSLLPYLIEEAYEVVEAVERDDSAHLAEELGDLLLQVVFHVVLSGDGRQPFTLAEVAGGIADKLIRRHPHVFAGAEVGDLDVSWEAQKAAEKGRRSALDGIPEQLPALARATKVVQRARARGVPAAVGSIAGAKGTVGERILCEVVAAHAEGLDPDASLRAAVRGLEQRVRTAEVVP